MLARTSAFLIWAAVAGAAVFWALQLFGAPPQAPPHALAAPVAAVARADPGRLLGADQSLPAAAPDKDAPAADQARFQLLGVIASTSSGWATIAVDGKTPRTYRVGQVVDGSSVLQKVAARGVEIGPRGGAPVVSLQLTPLPVAATGRPGALPAPNPAAVPGNAAPPQPPSLPDVAGPPSELRRPGPVNR